MRFSTAMILVGMLIISLYLLIEVGYYSYSTNADSNPQDTPYLKIPKIGVNQSINNQSVDHGIYFEPQSFKPTNGTTILFGHRTLHGSPFLKLDQLKPGDKIYVEWPGIGNVTYSMVNSTIVDASYQMPVEQGNNLFLITCYPLGSNAQRLIIQAEYETIMPINQPSGSVENPQISMGIMLICALFVGGMILGRVYPVAEDRIWIFIATLVLTLLLVFAYFYPVPTDALESWLSQLNHMLEF
ncbi:MAG TPA: class E sortase [Methanobacterium sp.]|jgi:LPXTG-site transpeptidase (sortase) family protein|nr:MAG: class E sortase [Methanobacterium sp.]HOI72196.1 class E sortase [Methanobacterium sp.]